MPPPGTPSPPSKGRRRRARRARPPRLFAKLAGWGRAFVERRHQIAPVVAALAIGAGAAAVGITGHEVVREQDRRRAALAAEVDRLQREARELRRSIASLRDDPAALELHAKRYHHLVEPGEVVVLLHPGPAEASGRPPAAPSEPR